MSIDHNPAKGGVKILRNSEVTAKCGISRATLWRFLNEEKYASLNFPKPVAISEHVNGFLEHEIDAWLMSRPQAVA